MSDEYIKSVNVCKTGNVWTVFIKPYGDLEKWNLFGKSINSPFFTKGRFNNAELENGSKPDAQLPCKK